MRRERASFLRDWQLCEALLVTVAPDESGCKRPIQLGGTPFANDSALLVEFDGQEVREFEVVDKLMIAVASLNRCARLSGPLLPENLRDLRF